MKTSELTGPALDWAVAKCEGYTSFEFWHTGAITTRYENGVMRTHSFSTDWAQGGPIIERERIRLEPLPDNGWRAYLPGKHGIWIDIWGKNATPLIAAMRCYVASVLGDEVEIPEELT